MTMTRVQFFTALRPAFPNQSIPTEAVAVIDAVADELGIAPAVTLREPIKPAPVPLPVSKPVSKGMLATVIGAVAAAALVPFVSGWESGGKQYLAPYQDIVGVWTQCDGETLGVTALSPKETPEGCAIKLDKRLAGFAQQVVACTPNLRGRDNQWAAAVSLTYNIGADAYCKSTVDRQFDAGNFAAACNAFSAWRYAGGKIVQGLVNRRAAERELCLKGL